MKKRPKEQTYSNLGFPYVIGVHILCRSDVVVNSDNIVICSVLAEMRLLGSVQARPRHVLMTGKTCLP